jgi:formyltetrahydrofolate-dependent phosphoribosylglycinamide formyltransferase
MTRTRIAVLASGGGTNLQAIFDHFQRLGERRHGDVVVVASDRADAGALARARARGVAAERLTASAELAPLLDRHRVALVVLAGYLRHVADDVVHRYAGRIVNVHPALLPAFGGPGMYGARVHDAVLAAGVAVTGVTVHFVDEVYDRGTIIAQWPVPVLAGDDRDRLAARVLRVEHILYPRVVNAVAGGKITLAGCQRGERPGAGVAEFTMLSREDDCLAEDIDRALGC